MKIVGGSLSKLSAVPFTLIALVALGIPALGQASKPALDPVVQRNVEDWVIQGRGVPEDWSHHHLVFSNPGTEEQAIRAGRYEKWQKIVNDPRFTIQNLKRNTGTKPVAGADLLGGRIGIGIARPRPKQPTVQAIKKDWAEGVGAGTINPNTYPAIWTNSISTASCTGDFVVYPTGVAGTTSTASLIAYYNIYSGCGGTVPSVDWAYNTGGTISTSPVFSYAGDQMAFIQTTSSVASLVLLRFPSTLPGTGTLASPITPNAASSASNYHTGSGCTAPCSYTLTLNGSPNDTWSSPYYDFVTDTLYVGDSVGKLHKFTPVFYGALTEVTTAWPVQLARGTTTDSNQLNGPVFDSTSGNVFVGTISDTKGSSGYLYSVKSTSGAINGYSAQLDTAYGLRDSVLVDSNAARVYAFVGYDTNSSSTSSNSGVYQFSTTGFSGSTASIAETTTGGGCTGGGTTNTNVCYMMSGTFDNTYYNSSNSASPTGYLYVGSTTAAGHLYQIPITSNSMGSASDEGEVVASGYYARFSPITEFYNTSAVASGGSGAHATGTFSSTGATKNQTITINNTLNSNTLTLTGITGTAGTGTITVANEPSSGDTLTIGGTAYSFHGSSRGCGSTANCIIRSGTVSLDAANIEAAINDTPGECGTTAPCFYNLSAKNASVSATVSGAVVTVTNSTSSTVAWSTSDTTALTLSPTATVPANSTGNNGCSSATAGTFAVSTTPATEATNLNAALTSCGATYGIGVTSTVSGAVVTVTDTTLGTASTLKLGGTASNFTWSAVTAGVNPTYTAADLIFFSVLAGSQTGCTGTDSYGCVISYNVTTPSSISLAGSTLSINAASGAYSAPTGGLVIDNSVGSGSLAGASQIYYLSTYSANGSCTTAGTGICATQASQTAP
jgi:hypothetical protein